MSLIGLIRGFRSSDNTAQPVRLDRATNTLQTMSYEHHEIHAGSSFTVSFSADVANGANHDILLITPDTTKWAHLTYELETELESDFKIYEAPTATAGDALVIYNRDRNSLTAATVTASSTPTSITPGTTILRSYHFGSGRSFGGGERGAHEFILKQNTKYLFRVTNATSNNNWISLKLDWYEHTNIT
jgi:hypothetical protein